MFGLIGLGDDVDRKLQAFRNPTTALLALSLCLLSIDQRQQAPFFHL